MLASDAITATIVVSPQGRKLPRCSKCKRPRKGHPRAGCPFVDLPPLKAADVTCESGSKRETGSTPIESLDVEAAVAPLQALKPSIDCEKLAPAQQSPPPARIFHDADNDVFITPMCFQEPLHMEVTAAAAASTRPLENTTATNIATSSHIPLLAGDLFPNLSTSSIPPLNEQSGEPLPAKDEQNAKLGGVELCPIILGSVLRSAKAGKPDSDSFTSILSASGHPEAAHAVIIIPNQNADVSLDQASAVKLKESAVNNLYKINEGLKAVPIQLIFGHEEKMLQGFVFTGMIANGTGGARKVHLQGGLPMRLQTAVFAAFVGAITAWTVMAYA
ncbi:hypothetical protein HYPSUDRAFT_199040 [Hypholoma sublateritium FD-334 SS-4]|uniref:Uncharacterized protein n=1 Tax=Hypholoma sublateritium (strain FD-334 SS-4) TaxID=945553 RepID=A0A0D2MQM4_HYPSF|nr:hypothetical protein HYPSUDRAFT_199040 [Hypholoma sublateritium FD-334 SS-4]